MYYPGKKVIVSVSNDLVNDRRMKRICSSLRKYGYSVLFTGRKQKHSASLPPEPYRQHRIRCLFNRGMLFYTEFNLRLFFFLLFSGADIFVAADLDTLPANWLVTRLRRKILVYDAHEYFTEVPELKDRYLVKKIWETIAWLCIPGADLCYTVSPPLAEILSKRYRRPFRVIMNTPLLHDDFPPLIENDPPVLVYQGALNPGRGIEEIIMAMQGISGVLKIAGEGPLKKKLLELTEKSALADKVSFAGMISASDLPAFTALATIGFNLLTDDCLSYRYSLSNKFFDYIHAGIPQLCADMPAYKAMNSRYDIAVLCKGSVSEITDTVNSLLSDKAMLSRLRENCRIAATELNWQIEEKKLVEYYSSLR